MTVLAAWGFHENAKEALDYRTRNYIASSAQHRVEAAPELKRDENGKVILPEWFVKRQEQIQAGEINPDDPTGIPRARATVDEDGNPWFIKTPFDPNAPVQIPESDAETEQATNVASKTGKPINVEAAQPITVEPIGRAPAEPINVVLQPGERTIIYQDGSAPHDEL